jgi:sulfur carrier protein ThiS
MALADQEPLSKSIHVTHRKDNGMKILFVNNDGGGFADHIEIPHGTTVQELFDRQMRQAKAENYFIRVNRKQVPRDQVLVEGDRVSMTPTKIEGARIAQRRYRWAA